MNISYNLTFLNILGIAFCSLFVLWCAPFGGSGIMYFLIAYCVFSCRTCGQVGYVVMGIRNVHDAHIGDTFHHASTAVDPLPGFKPAKPMVQTYTIQCFIYTLGTIQHIDFCICERVCIVYICVRDL